MDENTVTLAGVNNMKITVKAGTEEIGFYSETGTYNRDDISCIDFAVPKELSERVGQLIEKIKEMQMLCRPK